MEQHAVPQHIASFEFKLFGNLTLRQFVFLAIPLALAAAIFYSNLPVLIRYISSGLIAIVGGFVALVPYNGRSLDKWFVIFVRAVSNPTQRIWMKEAKMPDFLNIVFEEPVARKNDKEPEISRKDTEKLFEYLRTIPKGQVSPLDVREQLALERLGLTAGGAAGGKLPEPIFWGATQTDKGVFGRLEVKEPEVSEPAKKIKLPKGIVSPEELRHIMGHSLPGLKSEVVGGVGVRISTHLKPFALPGLEKRLHAQARQAESVKAPSVQLASEANFSIENVIPITTPSRMVRLVHGVGKTRARKLHFAPPPNFNLSDLPIRGEARFEISEELKRRYEKEEQDMIKLVHDQTQPEPISRQKGIGFEQIFKSAFSQAKAAVSGVGVKLQHNAASVPASHKSLQKPAVIAKHIGDFSPEASLKEEEKEQVDSQVSLSSKKAIGRPTEADVLTKAQIIPLTDKPNVISGLVSDNLGVPAEGLIVIIRDVNGMPLRALKTNKLGQFLSVTPLPAGTYRIEVEGEEQNFEPISIILTDKVIEPLEVRAKS